MVFPSNVAIANALRHKTYKSSSRCKKYSGNMAARTVRLTDEKKIIVKQYISKDSESVKKHIFWHSVPEHGTLEKDLEAYTSFVSLFS